MNQVLWYSHFTQCFPHQIVVDAVKCLTIINKAYIYFLPMLPLSLHYPPHVSLFNLYAERIMRMAGLVEAEEEKGVRIAGRTLNNLRYADDTTLLAGKKIDLVEMIRRLKKESEKAGLYFNMKKTKIMSTGEEDSFEVDGEELETVTTFTFLGSVIEREGKCDMEIKRRVALGKTAMNGMEKIWKDKNVRIDTKKRLVRALIIPIITYGSESWTMTKKMEKKINACEM